jgi:hypothetical protein
MSGHVVPRLGSILKYDQLVCKRFSEFSQTQGKNRHKKAGHEDRPFEEDCYLLGG